MTRRKVPPAHRPLSGGVLGVPEAMQARERESRELEPYMHAGLTAAWFDGGDPLLERVIREMGERMRRYDDKQKGKP